MTRSDKWKKRPVVQEYFSYRDDVKFLCSQNGYVQGDSLDIVFQIPFPASYTKKKRASLLGRPHQEKPDIDNLVKAWLDACLSDDKKVWDVRARKVWGEKGRIFVKPNHQP